MNKFLLKLTLLAVLIYVVAPFAIAADKIDVRQAMEVLNKVREIRGDYQVSLQTALGMDQDTTLKLIAKTSDERKSVYYRYEMLYKGIPVWGHSLIVKEDGQNRAVVLYGHAITKISEDILDVRSALDAQEALNLAKKHHEDGTKGKKWNYSQEASKQVVYFDGKQAHLAYESSFFAEGNEGPTSPVYIIDAKSKQILKHFEGLMTEERTATGPGGNEKTGKYYYGQQYDAFTVDFANGKSTMDVKGKVKVVNLGHGYSYSSSTPYSFDGTENTEEKDVNGAYCPMNDAQAFGMAVYNMYMEWYGMPPLDSQLVLKVHYKTGYENAFFTNGYMVFGDGAGRFYPLVSVDVVSHEIGHGVTRRFSNLTYSGESGGINESFSDMAGESCEYFVFGTNDFEMGATIFKQEGKALRYMSNPPLDGKSIDHVSNYSSGIDVHYSCGIYNKVFYLLANSSGWNTKKAFDVFFDCNKNRWTAGATFKSAGQAVYDSVKDAGLNTDAVVSALKAVGVDIVK